MSGSPASSIQTRTLLWSSPRQVPMAHNLRFRKENLQIPEKVNESRFLLSGHGVARLALLIEPSLIADADRASIIRSGMSPHLQQLTVLRHRTILSDVEVVADVIKPTRLMVTAQLFHTIVLIASASRCNAEPEISQSRQTSCSCRSPLWRGACAQSVPSPRQCSLEMYLSP